MKNKKNKKMKKANHYTVRITCLLAVCLLILFACKKEEEEIIFEGITYTGDDGVIYDSTFMDETDWRADDAWPSRVHDLFQHSFFTDDPTDGSRRDDFPKLDTTNETILKNAFFDTIGFGIYKPSWPNPCTDKISFSCYSNDEGMLQFVVVDQNFEVYIRYRIYLEIQSFTTFVIFGINFPICNEFKHGNIYRFYYRFETDAGIISLGHGDFVKY